MQLSLRNSHNLLASKNIRIYCVSVSFIAQIKVVKIIPLFLASNFQSLKSKFEFALFDNSFPIINDFFGGVRVTKFMQISLQWHDVIHAATIVLIIHNRINL